MEWLVNNWQTILMILGGIYAVASAIATLTPTTKDDDFLSKVGRFFDRIGLQLKTPRE